MLEGPFHDGAHFTNLSPRYDAATATQHQTDEEGKECKVCSLQQVIKSPTRALKLENNKTLPSMLQETNKHFSFQAQQSYVCSLKLPQIMCETVQMPSSVCDGGITHRWAIDDPRQRYGIAHRYPRLYQLHSGREPTISDFVRCIARRYYRAWRVPFINVLRSQSYN